MKKIAVIIQNHIQLESIKAGIDELIDLGIRVDIFSPEIKYEENLELMHKSIAEYLKKEGYNVFRKNKEKTKYDILLEPYPLDSVLKFNYKKRIKYQYAAVTAKAKTSYLPEINVKYDCVLTNSTYDKNIFSIYTNTYEIGNLKYTEFKPKKHKSTDGKKTILYLPTYGQNENIKEIEKSFADLRKKYKIIIKLHHQTHFIDNFVSELNDVFDEVHLSDVSLKTLLERADLVISDNSAAVFEAMYLKIPVCVFTKDLYKYNLGIVEPLQNKLIKKKILLQAKEALDLEEIIEKTYSKEIITKQEKYSNEIFKQRNINNPKSVERFVEIINRHLDNDYFNDRIHLREELIKFVSLNTLKEQKNNLTKELEIKNNLLNEYETGKLYKISKQIYVLIHNIKEKLRKKE